ncbi:MAG: DUF2892 domain-containing protein [bacterium]
MKKNMGTADRAIRVVSALVIVTLLLMGQIEGVIGITLGVLAVVFLGTSVVSVCPLYMPFKISTRKEITSAKK